MAKDGNVEQPASGAEVPSSEEATDLVETVDAVFNSGAEEQESEAGEQESEVREEPTDDEPSAEDAEESEGSDGDEAEEEDSEEEEPKSAFSEEGYKIFRGRIGKEKAKREKVEKELETVRSEFDALKKEADPNIQSARAAGIDSRFVETADAETLAEAAKVEHRINWLTDVSSNPDGYEDPNGRVWSQAEIAATLARQSSDPKNQKLLARAAGIQETASERMNEVIEAGLKALADAKKADAALKKKSKAAKKPSPAAPSSAAPSTHQPGKAAPGVLDTRAFDKKGRTDEALAEEF